ncbi:hypothetical protein SMU26_06641 [Streptococcus mutans 3SN1]|nr:hypothetical protein SMU26_06641 [Streptococcus mutans 3SN1]
MFFYLLKIQMSTMNWTIKEVHDILKAVIISNIKGNKDG